MQYVNDDIDDLLKKAGKNYPLYTNSGDWEKIANALNKNSSQLSENKSRQKFYFLVLLIPTLLFLPYVISDELMTDFFTGKSSALKAENILNEKDSIHIADLQKPLLPVESKELLFENKGKSTETNTLYSTQTFNSASLYNRNDFFEKNKVPAIIESSQPGAFYSNYISSLKTNLGGQIEFDFLKKDLQRQNVVPNPLLKSASNKKIKRFYAGIISGASATTVKFQKVNNHGFDVGFIAGYDINKKWSLEAGILSTQKKYYTDGKEFNTSKMYLPANTKITTVDGGCRMIELPVVARYHFSSSQENTWFVSGGISSFLMKEESYDYTYLYTNSGRTVKYSKTYKDISENWISTVQVSGGYIFHVKDKLEIRAEPYVQIPLKGVGLGNLPLTNTGLRIGITRKLF
jgi:hypothetical protein